MDFLYSTKDIKPEIENAEINTQINDSDKVLKADPHRKVQM